MALTFNDRIRSGFLHSRRALLAGFCLVMLVPPVFAHDHDMDMGAQAHVGKLGDVDFPTSCKPAVQGQFRRGVAMLHSFWYREALKNFQEVLDQDPTCAIADWGIASILMDNPLAGVGASAAGAEKARAAIDKARSIGAGTQRERDYIDAVDAYYKDWGTRDERDRQRTRSLAFDALAKRYPDDDEAQIFDAVYIAATQSRDDQTYAAYRRAIAILEPQFAKHPDHPGVAHYLIHSYDAPALAQQGLLAARRYADIAPAAPHALHMPSHIFTRVGAWNESAATNQRSADVAQAGHDLEEELHALDYEAYADIQLGRIGDARRVVDRAAGISGFTRWSGYYAFSAIPARFALETGDWAGAGNLVVHPDKLHYPEAQTRFARAMGDARSGHPAAADEELKQLALLRDALTSEKNTYWASEVNVSWLAASAWTALARKDTDQALSLMREAADTEDHNEKHIVTPGRMLPARELLGEMLLALNRPAEALVEFETSQKREPNRYRGLAGAAVAAEKAGDSARAQSEYAQLVETAGNGDSRPELTHARAYLASHAKVDSAASSPAPN